MNPIHLTHEVPCFLTERPTNISLSHLGGYSWGTSNHTGPCNLRSLLNWHEKLFWLVLLSLVDAWVSFFSYLLRTSWIYNSRCLLLDMEWGLRFLTLTWLLAWIWRLFWLIQIRDDWNPFNPIKWLNHLWRLRLWLNSCTYVIIIPPMWLLICWLHKSGIPIIHERIRFIICWRLCPSAAVSLARSLLNLRHFFY